jgi:hypothetical protein
VVRVVRSTLEFDFLALVVAVEGCCSRLHTGFVNDWTANIRVPPWSVVCLLMGLVDRTEVESKAGSLEQPKEDELGAAATVTAPLTVIFFEIDVAPWMEERSLHLPLLL